jgi:hypothetical protein
LGGGAEEIHGFVEDILLDYSGVVGDIWHWKGGSEVIC